MNGLIFQYLAVACGGAVGAICRFTISMWLPFSGQGIPIGTLVANAMGSFLIGILYVTLVELELVNSINRELWMIGFLGALTTFSTFSLETIRLIETGSYSLAALYVVLSVIICIVAAFAGLYLARALFP